LAFPFSLAVLLKPAIQLVPVQRGKKRPNPVRAKAWQQQIHHTIRFANGFGKLETGGKCQDHGPNNTGIPYNCL